MKFGRRKVVGHHTFCQLFFEYHEFRHYLAPVVVFTYWIVGKHVISAAAPALFLYDLAVLTKLIE